MKRGNFDIDFINQIKSMIYKLLNTDPSSALNGTTALNTVALINGANILRVHDVKQANEVIKYK